MALAEAPSRKPLLGHPQPRVAPPLPARSEWKAFRAQATELGLDLFPWQETTARYTEARDAKGLPLFREVAVIVARRNGKTTLLRPLIVSRMLDGQRISHAAQQLYLPTQMFLLIVADFEAHYPELIPKKRGISWRAGQEEIRLTNGATYRPIAANNGAARGLTNDVVIIDELREMTDVGVLSALKPTTAQSPKRQMIYLSNAGTADSAALKSIQARAGADESLAYLEWSAAPERKPDEVAGWLEANPAIGHNPAILESLEEDYRAALLGGTMSEFEVERLCREQVTLAERLVTDEVWGAQDVEVGKQTQTYMAIAMDPGGERASAVVAWQEPDGRVSLEVHDFTGSPISPALLGPDLQKLATANRARVIAFDPYTDADLVRYLRLTEPIRGPLFTTASSKFSQLAADRKFRLDDPAGTLAADLRWTKKKPEGQTGAFKAVRVDDEHSITAANAAIRATWLASRPPTTGPARIF